MKIYTKKGDKGTTSLLGGTRVSKDHVRIEAYGTIDELNAYMGMIHDLDEALSFREIIQHIQHQLFNIGSILAKDPEDKHFKLPEVAPHNIDMLEESIDKMEQELPVLTNFILPGGHPANSLSHVTRCICRRAERRIISLNTHAPVSPIIMQYLNRLSDWLFVLSRTFSYQNDAEEIVWKPQNA